MRFVIIEGNCCLPSTILLNWTHWASLHMNSIWYKITKDVYKLNRVLTHMFLFTLNCLVSKNIIWRKFHYSIYYVMTFLFKFLFIAYIVCHWNHCMPSVFWFWLGIIITLLPMLLYFPWFNCSFNNWHCKIFLSGVYLTLCQLRYCCCFQFSFSQTTIQSNFTIMILLPQMLDIVIAIGNY